MSDHLIKFGTPPADDAKRDAIHIAVAPARAGERLNPGQPIRLDGCGYAWATTWNNTTNPPIGIVDPFLQQPVEYAQAFWVAILPGTTKNLRHHWDHPSFPERAAITSSDDDEEEREDDGCRGCYS